MTYTIAINIKDILKVAIKKQQSPDFILSNKQNYSLEYVKAAEIHKNGNAASFIKRVSAMQKQKLAIAEANLTLSMVKYILLISPIR